MPKAERVGLGKRRLPGVETRDACVKIRVGGNAPQNKVPFIAYMRVSPSPLSWPSVYHSIFLHSAVHISP